MENIKRYSIRKILLTSLWSVLGAGAVVLLVAAIRIKDTHRCKEVEINIEGVNNNFFVDKKDIINSITSIEEGNPVGKAIGSFDLKSMEKELEKNIWVRSAELFFDNNEVLHVNVHEREPVARVFTTSGTTFYIDNDLAMLPLSDKFSARLPVFTGFPSAVKVLSKADSALLMDIKKVSLAIQKDSFCMAMIDQVDITSQRLFEMIPKIGNQLIVFGDGADAGEKLEKLKVFYKEIMLKAGWSTYSVINIQYKNQVVAKKRGSEDILADSMRTLQIMEMIVERAQQQTSDSLQIIQQDSDRNTVDSSMIQQSIQREESAQPSNTFEKPKPQEEQTDPPALKPNPVTAGKNAVKQTAKPVQKPPSVETGKQQPKAVMPKKTN